MGSTRACRAICFFLGLRGAAVALSAQTLVVVKPAGKEPVLAVGGLLQAQAEAGDRGDSRFTNDNDRFYLRRARLNATGKFLEEFDFRLELDLAGSLSNTSGLRAQLTDGYITWNRYPAANVRAGQFKTPFGFEQLYGDPRLLTLERTLVNDRLTLSRQIGAQVVGDLLEKRFTYAAGLFNGNSVNNNFNDNDKFAFVARLAVIPWQGKLFGQSANWAVGANGYSTSDTALALSADLGLDSIDPCDARPGRRLLGRSPRPGLRHTARGGPLRALGRVSEHTLRAVQPHSEGELRGGRLVPPGLVLPDSPKAPTRRQAGDLRSPQRPR